MEAVVREQRKPEAQRHRGIAMGEYLVGPKWFCRVGV